jgi:zeaxanthin glucosyltransferase
MAHFGAICDPGPSHVMAMTAICRELKQRGHQATLFAFPALDDPAMAAGMDVRAVGSDSDFVKRRADWISQARKLKSADFLTIATERARIVCEHGPPALRAAKIDCVLADGIDPGAATAAESLNLPFVTINNALPLNQEPGVPLDFVPWRYHDAAWARARNWFAYRLRDVLIRPLHRELNRYRRECGLRRYHTPDDSFSPYAQITQLIPEFDFPRKHLPPCFHYVGPYRREAASSVQFPYDRLDGRPLVYASMGTIQGSRSQLWDAITDACARLDVQLVLSLGKCKPSSDPSSWAGKPVVVDYAAQPELIARASLAILHGGLNSAMEALAAGVPTVTLPVIGDQFGVGARVVYSGTGETIPAMRCNAASLHQAITKVLGGKSYRRRARELQQTVATSGGAKAAASIIHQVITTGKPVMRVRQPLTAAPGLPA